jgi:hypothetical protein
MAEQRNYEKTTETHPSTICRTTQIDKQHSQTDKKVHGEL